MRLLAAKDPGQLAKRPDPMSPKRAMASGWAGNDRSGISAVGVIDAPRLADERREDESVGRSVRAEAASHLIHRPHQSGTPPSIERLRDRQAGTHSIPPRASRLMSRKNADSTSRGRTADSPAG